MTDFHAPAGVAIRPGDGLLICFSDDPGQDHLNHLRRVLEEAYPGVMFFLLPHVADLVRYRPE